MDKDRSREGPPYEDKCLDAIWYEAYTNKRGSRAEAESNGCTGWKNPTECPHEGVFDPDSSACKECEEDASDAFKSRNHCPL